MARELSNWWLWGGVLALALGSCAAPLPDGLTRELVRVDRGGAVWLDEVALGRIEEPGTRAALADALRPVAAAMKTDFFLPDERPDHDGRGPQIPDGTLRVEVAPEVSFGDLKAVLEAGATDEVRIWKFSIEPCEATRGRRLFVYETKEWGNVCSLLPEGPFWSLGVVLGPSGELRFGVVDYDKRAGHRAPAVLAESPQALLELLADGAGELAAQPRVRRVATGQSLAAEPDVAVGAVLRALADFESERADWVLELLAPID